jgi:nucleoside-diphosphate-sugar epimerase
MNTFAQRISSAAHRFSSLLLPGNAGRKAGGSVVLTGHLGNVGGRLLKCLRESDWTVHGIDMKDGPEFDLANSGPEARWPTVLKQADILIHLAATPGGRGLSEDVERNNFVALENVFNECCRCRHKKVVFASSLLASPGRYGHPSNSILPINHYGWSKVFAESVAQNLASDTQTKFTAIRLGYVPPDGTDLTQLDDWTRSVITSDRKLASAFLSALTSAQARYSVAVAFGR